MLIYICEKYDTIARKPIWQTNKEKVFAVAKKTLAAFISIICLIVSFGCSDEQVFLPDVKGGLFINEVVSKNAFSLIDEDLGTPDWIEIYNSTSHAISLNEYGLSDNINRPFLWKFPDITIEPDGYLIVYATQESQEQTEKNSLCTGFKISSLGESIILTSPEGSMIQELKVPQLLTDVSWGRNKDGIYCFYSRPTPGEDNGELGMDSLDDIIQSIPLGALQINEMMVDNIDSITDSNNDRSGWVEICNISGETVSLDGYFITDDPSNSTKWRFPDISLNPEEYIVVFLSGKDKTSEELHTSFKLNKQEKGLWLINPAGALEDKIQWQDNPPQSFSMGRDGKGNFVYFGLPTPGEPNAETGIETLEYSMVTTLEGVRINEFLINNKYSRIDEDGDRPAWAELYNASTQTINLAYYAISDNKNNPAKWRFPDIEIEPGEYLVVFLSGKDRSTSRNDLHTSFVLSKNDTELMLTNLRNMEYEMIALPDTLLENVSYGRSAQNIENWVYFAQPTPGQENTTKGFEDIFNVAKIDDNGIWINEVSAVSHAKSGKLDWIEIANGGDKDVSLKGYFLSDNDKNPYKWQVPDITVPAGGYAVIYASSKPSVQSKQNVAKLGVTYTGELLMLSSPDGNMLDVFETGVLRPDVTSGRAPGDFSGARVFFDTPTPGRTNKDEISSYTAKPLFSRPGGYAQDTFSLEIKCDTPNAKIYYTLDGSKPTQSSSLYTEPIKIKDTTVVKAIAYAENRLKSEMMVATYLFEKKHTVPVVCLSANPRDFSRAYNVTERRQRNEQEGYIEYYESDGTLGVSFPSGIRASGYGTLVHAQKSVSLFLRGGYGQSSVTYPFFKDFPYVTFESLTLRSSGQDKERARVRDAFCHLASREMDVDYSEYRLVVLYVNGEYFGLYDLRENQNSSYYAYRHNTTSDNIERISWNQTVLAGTSKEILSVRSFARSKNMSNEDNFAEFSKKVDTEAAMDYLIAVTFFCNSDYFNQKYGRAIDYSFKWRFLLFDFDYAMRNKDRNLLDKFFSSTYLPTGTPGNFTNTDIQYALYQNPGWREEFVERYAYVLNNIYTKEKLLTLFDEMIAEMEPEMERHIKRWGWPRSMSQWRRDVNDVRDFLEVRTEIVKKQLKSFFNLSSERMKELFPNG